MKEIWKPVVGFEGLYEVSDQGQVHALARRSIDGKRLRARMLKPFTTRNGYRYIDLVSGGHEYRLAVAFAVLCAFKGSAAPLQEVRSDNRASNLMWKTHAENCADKLIHGTDHRGEKSGTAKLTKQIVLAIRRRCAAGESQANVAADVGVGQPQIHRIVHKQRWGHV